LSGITGRILGLDFGDVRIGLALSDPLGLTAQPIGVLRPDRARDTADEIADLARLHEVTTVVVGLPLLMSGLEGRKAGEVRYLCARLAKRLPGVRIELWDERLTTVQAERAMIAGDVPRKRRREMADSLAAVLILQSYIDAHEKAASR
jgi:putative Holliday junction resolvase